ncbi:hypothetical protein QRQ56_20395 [Bradyrhizobium sp. U531]|uniref:hypothetical protein n=1 Tax=Bradyrhizobium sp. U531 TaxID=3053458 RepID=UPI003F41D511
MRPDLLEAQACVDWVMGELPDFAKRLEEWLTRGVTIEIKELDPPSDNDLIVAIENELLPLFFQAEAGAYINTIRSSLDILASTLVRRHSIPIAENRVYFPIAESKERFEKSKDAQVFVQGLDALGQRLFRDLKPYNGGNEQLWTLHRLDNVRKHRRLLNARLNPIHMSMVGTLKEGDFTPLGGDGSIQVGEETVLGLIRKGVPRPAIFTTFYVAIDEPGFAARKPVTAVLAQLASTATFIINFFDA